jgi:hypothetical protein
LTKAVGVITFVRFANEVEKVGASWAEIRAALDHVKVGGSEVVGWSPAEVVYRPSKQTKEGRLSWPWL